MRERLTLAFVVLTILLLLGAGIIRSYVLRDLIREQEAQHLSQAELARRMGSTQPAIARLEAGRVAPSLDTLDRAAAALGVELVITFQHPQRRGRRQLSG